MSDGALWAVGALGAAAGWIAGWTSSRLLRTWCEQGVWSSAASDLHRLLHAAPGDFLGDYARLLQRMGRYALAQVAAAAVALIPVALAYWTIRLAIGGVQPISSGLLSDADLSFFAAASVASLLGAWRARAGRRLPCG